MLVHGYLQIPVLLICCESFSGHFSSKSEEALSNFVVVPFSKVLTSPSSYIYSDVKDVSQERSSSKYMQDSVAVSTQD